MTGRSDEANLAWAAEQGRVLYTSNYGDFARLHWAWIANQRRHAGLVLRTWQRMPIGLQVRGLLAVAAAFDADSIRGEMIYLGEFVD